MKHHDGEKKINKVDGGKKRARKQYNKVLRRKGKKDSDDKYETYYKSEE